MVEQSESAPTMEDTTAICKKVLEEVVGQSGYQHTEAVKWNEQAVSTITQHLVALGRPFKYCVSCIIMQTGLGAGLNVASCCYWDSSSDHAYAYRWESKAVIAICNIFAVAI